MEGQSDRFYVVATQPGTAFRLAVEVLGSATAGRDPTNAVLLAHPLVSRKHARFTLANANQFLVEDLESRNGTSANGEPISGPTMLGNPAVIEIGPFAVSLSTSLSEETLTAASSTPTKMTRTMLDRGPRRFHVDGTLVLDSLSVHEYALLDLLEMRSPNVVERTAVGDAVWGSGQWDVYMLHNLVSRIRKRIVAQGASDSVIVTVPGVGYRLE